MPDRQTSGLGKLSKQLRTVYQHALLARPGFLIRNLVLAVFCLVLGKIVSATAPLIFKSTVDEVSRSPGRFQSAVWLIIGFSVARLLAMAFSELREVFFAKFAQPCIQAVASSAIEKLLDMSLLHFAAKRSNEYPALIERGVRGIEVFLSLIAFSVMPAIAELVIVCFLIGYFLDLRYAMIVCSSAIIFAGFTIRTVRRQDALRREMNRTSTEFGLRLREAASNIEIVQAFQMRSQEKERSLEALRAYGLTAVRNQIVSFSLHVGQAAIVSITLGICLLLVAADITAGAATVGSLVMLSMYLSQLFDPLSFLSYSYRNMRDGLIDAEETISLLETKIYNRRIEEQRSGSGSGVSIELVNVNFCYSEQNHALREVSFIIPSGTIVAIVGRSGAGKSTLAKLLVGLFRPDTGRVLYYRPIMSLSVDPLISYVPQEPQLFSGTVKFNIAYGRPKATDAEIEEAARIACIHHVIADLPNGYSTLLGDRGGQLSGGERQRIAIARAVTMRPDILVLDEGTSDLDVELEQTILSNIKRARSHQATIFITHRLVAAKSADQIIVVDAGKVVEMGTHRDLLGIRGLYARLAGLATDRGPRTTSGGPA
jgi:ATP-binding cassette, subfamily B, heavy metal transporter